MASVYAGKYLWIWELDHTLGGDLEKIAALGHTLGITGWVIKAHDGATIWPQFATAYGPLTSAGFNVAAWGYVYGDDPIGEAAAAQSALKAGAKWYVFDAEDTYTSKTAQAVQFGHLLKQAASSTVIGYTSFAFPNEHPGIPFQEFSTFCDVVLPQIYWADFAMNVNTAVTESFSQLKPYGLPIAPIGQAYGTCTARDILLFAQRAQQLGAQGISFWDAQSASSAQLRAISQVHVPGSSSFANPAPTGAANTRLATGPTQAIHVTVPSDVAKGDWYYGAVMDLLERNIITVYPDGQFRPNEPVTRAQAADWLHRLRVNLEPSHTSSSAHK